ncbi:MFS transporter [Photorhabdus australis]|uniref:MFS transporter n=1 Tax=Photorhabdus australis TaxID=286156 RepID=UPI000907CF62|nr:MFS transporter [Photorhabdus australis]
MLKYKIVTLYSLVFFFEFAFFCSLPILSSEKNLSAKAISGMLSFAVILECILMLTITNKLNTLSKGWIFLISCLLRAISFSFLILFSGLYSWLLFFSTLAISKAIAKPFTRDLLSEIIPKRKLKKAFYNYSFSQNAAIVLAPIAGAYFANNNYKNTFFTTIIIISLFFAFICFFTWKKKSKKIKIQNSITRPKNLGSSSFLFLLFSSFFSFSLMGIFITATTLANRINNFFNDYVGLFFTIVGLVVCLWQLIFSKLFDFSESIIKYTLILLSLISATYFSGGVTIAIIALIAYSIFEAIIIPEIYSTSSNIVNKEKSSMAFSLLLVMANIGEAVGSTSIGFIVDLFDYRSGYLINFFILLFSLLSVITLIISKKLGVKYNVIN